MTKVSPLSPIGIILPIKGGNSGYFDQSFDTVSQVKYNIINLLNTRQGERRMQPTFGTRIWNLVFEQNIDALSDIASNIIKEDISMWIPNVTIIDIVSNLLKSDQSNDDSDIYKLQISVSFMLNMTKQTDKVVITMDKVIT